MIKEISVYIYFFQKMSKLLSIWLKKQCIFLQCELSARIQPSILMERKKNFKGNGKALEACWDSICCWCCRWRNVSYKTTPRLTAYRIYISSSHKQDYDTHSAIYRTYSFPEKKTAITLWGGTIISFRWLLLNV